MKSAVIIISSPHDVHARSVAYRIQNDFKATAVIVDSADFPEKVRLSVLISPLQRAASFEIRVGDQCINSCQVAGI